MKARREPDYRTAGRGRVADESGGFFARDPAETAGAARLMPRYKLIIEYDGAPYCGWQVQENGPSVQGALETAVTAISGEAVRVPGAGRTAAAVHALAPVAHSDIATPFFPSPLPTRL